MSPRHGSNDLATHLCDTQPIVIVAVGAKLDIHRFVSVEVKGLVSKCFTARRDCAVVFTVIVYIIHIQGPGPLIAEVESDVHLDDVLRLFKGVGDAAVVPLARPARVRGATAVSSVVGEASLRVAAAILGCPVVVIHGFHVDRGLLTCFDQGWGGGRRTSGKYAS